MGPDKQNSTTNYRHDDKRVHYAKIEGELMPLDDYVYVEPDLQDDKVTEKGIFVPKPKYQGPPNTGTVLAIGKNITVIQVGDKVCFRDKNAWGFWLNDTAHIPLKQEQIIAIFKDEA